MIQADEVMPLLLHACPSFHDKWRTVEADDFFDSESGGRLRYLEASEFIRHMVELRLSGETAEFPAIFQVIERLLVEGDDYVTNLAVVGYLEGFQMRTFTDAGLDPEAEIRPYLSPESTEAWERLNEAWGGPSTLG